MVCKTTTPGASPGRTSIILFDRIRESQQHSLALEARAARGSTGVSDQFQNQRSVRSSMAEHQSHNLKRAGSTPAGPTKLTDCLVAQSVRAFAFEAKGWRCESARGCHLHFHAHVVQQQRHPPQKRSSAGATPAMGTISSLIRPCLGSPTVETADLKSAQCRFESCLRHPFSRSRLRSPTAETSASKAAQCECNSHRRHQLTMLS